MKHEITAGLDTHQRKLRHLVLDVVIKSSATPAAKTQSSDLSGVCLIATEGKDEIAAVDSVTLTPPDDATGVFSVLLDASKLGTEGVEKVYLAKATPSVGTITIAKSLTSDGNILISLDSNQDLSSQDLSVTLEIDYLLK